MVPAPILLDPDASACIMVSMMIDKTFLLAGAATFVIENTKGVTVTVQVKSPKKVKINRYTGQPFPKSYFVSTRFQNEEWQYQGLLTPSLDAIKPTYKTQYSRSQNLGLSKAIAEWAVKKIVTGTPVPTGYRLEHIGRCGKCGKMLRDDVSIQRGIGPECARQMGLI